MKQTSILEAEKPGYESELFYLLAIFSRWMIEIDGWTMDRWTDRQTILTLHNSPLKLVPLISTLDGCLKIKWDNIKCLTPSRHYLFCNYYGYLYGSYRCVSLCYKVVNSLQVRIMGGGSGGGSGIASSANTVPTICVPKYIPVKCTSLFLALWLLALYCVYVSFLPSRCQKMYPFFLSFISFLRFHHFIGLVSSYS